MQVGSTFVRCCQVRSRPENLAQIGTTELTYFIIIVSWLGEDDGGRNVIIRMDGTPLVNDNLLEDLIVSDEETTKSAEVLEGS